MKISIIIPTHNEAVSIGRLLIHLKEFGGNNLAEIIVCDAESKDGTLTIAVANEAIGVCSYEKSRAKQMNLGVYSATGDILCFIHADTLPPPSFATDILTAIAGGHQAGCFSYRFNSNKKSLRILSRFTRFRSIFTGGGDQILFIARNIFESIGGFDEKYILMEDFEIVRKLKKNYSFQLIPNDVLVSARKYDHNSFLRVQIANFLIFGLYKFGISPTSLKTIYKRIINRDVEEEIIKRPDSLPSLNESEVNEIQGL